ESMITGESLPVEKSIGSPVIGATINRSGMLTVQATSVGKNSALAQIIKLVERAQSSKAPIQQLADKISNIFVPIVLAVAMGTFIVWWLAQGELTPALLRMIAVLLISCPCAMGLATPLAVMVGMGRGAENGILFKSSEALQRIQDVDVVVLDKTGTVTEGRLRVTDFLNVPDTVFSEPELLRIAASAEAGSEHPIAAAVIEFAAQQQLDVSHPDQFQSVAGHGIRATVGSHQVLIGNDRLMQQSNINTSSLRDAALSQQAEAKAVMWIAIDGKLQAIISVADTIKPDSVDAIRRLRDRGLQVLLITGDNQATATAIAKQVGISDFQAEVLPEHKADAVKKLQDSGKVVAMIGDGINDAPALAQADVGIAIGTGTDVAMETADVTLMRGELSRALDAIKLSQATLRNIKQNLFWAFGYNVALIPIAAGVLAPFSNLPDFLRQLHPIMAAFAMVASDLVIVTNALRLKRFRF
ncbi:MAG: copper-translocating P-type ATPase, partial [Planctomycetales bacterium]|nr:copper-translocating P-type ATPase [Planctomycetales bacterium]